FLAERARPTSSSSRTFARSANILSPPSRWLDSPKRPSVVKRGAAQTFLRLRRAQVRVRHPADASPFLDEGAEVRGDALALLWRERLIHRLRVGRNLRIARGVGEDL